jgi:hypothetical protein
MVSFFMVCLKSSRPVSLGSGVDRVNGGFPARDFLGVRWRWSSTLIDAIVRLPPQAPPLGLRFIQRMGWALTGRGGRAVRDQRGIERAAGVVGQRRGARGRHGLRAHGGGTPGCAARWSVTCSRFSLPRSLVLP